MISNDFDNFGMNQPPMRLGNNVKIKIKRFKIIQLDVHNPMYMRPYQTTMSQNVENSLQNLVHSFEKTLPPTAIAASVSEFILPSAAPEFKMVNNGFGQVQNRHIGVDIANGWSERRFVFTMEVSVTSNGLETTELVTGYTDRVDGVYVNGRMDNYILADDTVFYINAVSILSQRNVGGNIMPVLCDSLSVLGGGLGSGHFDNNTPWKMTPMNLLDEGKAQSANIGMSTYPEAPIAGSDHRAVSSVPSLTRRYNNSPTHYFGQIVDRYRNAYNACQQSGNHADSMDLLQNVRGTLVDPGMSSIGFMSWLTSLNQRTTNIFTMGLMRTSCPEIESIMELNNVQIRTTASTGAGWHASDRETQMAMVVANMVTNLCLKSSITTLSFSSSNNNMQAMAVTMVNFMTGFTPNTPVIHLEPMIRQSIDDELIPVISANNHLGYNLDVRYNSNMEIEVRIGFETSEPNLYVFPAFADALLSPILTTDSKLLQRNSRDINTVINEVNDQISLRNAANGNLNYPTPSDFMGNVNSQMNYNPANNFPNGNNNFPIGGNNGSGSLFD